MSGLFEGIVRENPLYVDNSEKYAKRAEKARNEAVKAATEASSSASSAKSEAEAARLAAIHADTTRKDIDVAHEHIHKDKDEVSRNTEQVGKDRVVITEFIEEARVLDKKFDGDKAAVNVVLDKIATHHTAITPMYNEVVDLHPKVVSSANAAKVSETNAKRSEEITTQSVSESNEILTEARDTQKRLESFQVEVIAAKDEAVASKDAAFTSKVEAKGSEDKSKEWHDKSYDLYLDIKEGQVHRGTWNPKTGAYPAHQGTNSVWDVILDDGVPEVSFDNQKWRNGDRLLYNTSEKKYDRLSTGGGVTSVNGKHGAITLEAVDVKALPITGGSMTGSINIGRYALTGVQDKNLIRDHGNGNVTVSASARSDGTAGDLYLGYSDSGGASMTKSIRLESPATWKGSTTLIDSAGKLNSESMSGPIRTEKDSGNVTHTIIGGTDNVNRGRTMIAAGECGKVIYDNTKSGSETVHIGGDGADGVYVYTNLQGGWAGRKTVKFLNGEMYAVDGTKRVYHEGNKPTATELDVVPRSDVNYATTGGYDVIAGKIPRVKPDGVMEVGKYIDFHDKGSVADFDVRLEAIGEVLNIHTNEARIKGQAIYHKGNKPTAADVGAITKADDTGIGNLTLAPGKILNASITHQRGYMSIYPFGPTYGLDGASGNRCRMYYKEHNNGKPDEISRGLVISSTDTDGTNRDMDIWVGGRKVYHEGNKPTVADIGAVSATTVVVSGDTIQFMV